MEKYSKELEKTIQPVQEIKVEETQKPEVIVEEEIVDSGQKTLF